MRIAIDSAGRLVAPKGLRDELGSTVSGGDSAGHERHRSGGRTVARGPRVRVLGDGCQ